MNNSSKRESAHSKVSDKELLATVYVSMQASVERFYMAKIESLPFLLCDKIPEVLKLNETQKEKMLRLSRLCKFSIEQLCDILHYSKSFFSVFIFSLDDNEFAYTFQAIINNQDSWCSFIKSLR